MTKETILKKYFGYSAFRPGQEEIIDHLLQGRDAMCIMPTGAGKSICYQVPAMAMEGITIVVSPLISLMKDQVAALTQAGIPAAFLNSSLEEDEAKEVLFGIRSGRYKLLYAAPERLLLPGFLAMCKTLPIAMVAVDEAHCVSQWGQDFRPSYLNIAPFIEALPQRPVTCAFTATATDKVRGDVIRILKLNDPFTLTTGFDRPNLTFHTSRPKSRKEALFSVLLQHRNDSGIIYCSTRKTVEEVCDKLQDRGFAATRYHAGLTDAERKENQEAFINDDCPLMVATNAFGMGIDKSNVRFVVHYNMPKCLESYYQEAGRAGRDGLPSDCYLFYNAQDVHTCRWFIENSDNDQLTEEQKKTVKEQDELRLKAMIRYAKTEDCLRRVLLEYFGEKAPANCGNCSNCLENYERIDATEDARKALSCIFRNDGRLGLAAVSACLRGEVPPSMEGLQLQSQTTFGLLQGQSEQQVRRLLTALIDSGYARAAGDAYATLSIADQERTALLFKNKETFFVQQRKEKKPLPKAESLSPRAPKDAQLLYRLQEWRKAQAAREKQPAYIIFSDAVLHRIAEKKPRTKAELLAISGIGEKKAQRYGDAILLTVLEFEAPKKLDPALKKLTPGTVLTNRKRGPMTCVAVSGSVIYFRENATGKVFKYRLDSSLSRLFVL
ncbi:MAG: DNA helicase RecQ [Firmicutes bacterium]|nr:DNA helicase RecQ [Bacillota bacterium]